MPKNWCFWTVVLERTPESLLDYKMIKPINPKENQSWIFIGRTDAEAPILWPPKAKNQLIGKDPDAGKDWGQEEGMTEDEMVGCHHQLDGHGFGWTLGVGDGQGGLACCSSWVTKSWTRLSDWIELTDCATSRVNSRTFRWLRHYLLIQGVRVRSQVRELRSHMLHGQKTKS